MSDWKPDVFTFTDFREYLGAYYQAAKTHNPAFSYRYFARRAGYSSPNFLQLVIQGKRRLTADGVRRFVRALKLSNAEARFFAHLVDFNQATSDDERNLAFEKVAASRRFRQARKIDSALYLYASHWYYPAIREMAARADFREDPEWIARQLLPAIKPIEARQALDVLFELELLERRPDGTVHRGDATLASSRTVRSLTVSNFHRQMLERAAESIELVDARQRELGALTVCISQELVPELVRRVRDFRATLSDLCDRDPDPQRVYQINFQVFPLTREDDGHEA